MSTALPEFGLPTEFPVPVVNTEAAPVIATVKVLHLINGEHYSGAERVQDLLALKLPEFGYEVGFACVKPGRFAAQRKAQAASLYEVPMRSKLDLRAAARLCEILRRDGYRIVHAHTPRTVMVGRIAAAWADVPLVYHVHSPTARDSTHRVKNWINAATERLSLQGAKALIAVSTSLGRHMRQQGFSPRLISVVPNGVPIVCPTPERKPPSGTWTLGTIALFRPRKGTEVLLDALALLRRRGLAAVVRAVGPFETPDYEYKIKSQIDRLGLNEAVHWVGFTQDVNTELAHMDLMVLPSLFGEGLPMVVLEAMAAGVPVVATRVEGVPEAIRDGLDGVLAEPGDPASLADAIARIMTGEIDWAGLRSRALARQARQFSDRSMAAGVAEVYRRLLK